MASPIKDEKYPVSTPFGVKGDRWSSGRHEGVDFKCPVGTPIVAPCAGLVVKVGKVWGAAFGLHSVLLRTKFGYVIFAHMKDYKVAPGWVVKKGELLGHSGAEGNVTGPHLHMELQKSITWKSGGGINPQPVLDA